MELDATACYRALRTRDSRFDGRFFTAVRSTGIYCRPVCPARTPKRENCTFYPSAAAAQEAGYRPCLRCRPEVSPGLPATQGTAGTVTRALRMIAEGALDDEGGVEQLAARLGIGERHLRRLFLEHLNATPVTVAQTQRVLLAKKLLSETRVPITEIAYASGFASLRRFNDAMRSVYGRPPREIRQDPAHSRCRRAAPAPTRLPAALRFRLAAGVPQRSRGGRGGVGRRRRLPAQPARRQRRGPAVGKRKFAGCDDGVPGLP